MHTIFATRYRRQSVRWLRPHSLALRLAACMLCVSLATGLAGAMAEGNLIWVANGVILAYLLLAPRRLWPAYLCAGLLGHAVGTIVIHAAWQVNLVDTPLDVLEAFLSALFLRRRSAQLPRFTQGKYLLRFLAYAVLAAPLITGLLHGAITVLLQHAAFSAPSCNGSRPTVWAHALSLQLASPYSAPEPTVPFTPEGIGPTSFPLRWS